jgi:hypothetical protein
MNITELDRYRLSDAVKFNARLNPAIWGKDEHLLPEVREQLLKIADDFREFLGLSDLEIKDITISGSNAAYTYTPHSDIDLHLVADIPQADRSEVYRELFDAKKYQYNDQFPITIGGNDVELYVQNANEPPVSQGEYSVLNNEWIQVPRRERAAVDDRSTRSKYTDIKRRIQQAIRSNDHETLSALMKKIRTMRQAGLDEHGEFGSENLAFKMLRSQGFIKKLADARNAARGDELSLDERKAASKPKHKKYGFGGYWFPGTAYAGQDHPDGTESVSESVDSELSKTLNKFAASCIDYLDITKAPKLVLHPDTDWSEQTGSFGQYDQGTNILHLATHGRHTLDILRTMAHEFTHRKQAEQESLPLDAGKTGSKWEDEANAMAGRIMRYWAEKHPEMFAQVPLEEASGYIPTKKQANDPRFVMALTKDVQPGAVGKEANKLGLQTDAQGRPALLTAKLNESLAAEFAAFAEGKSYGYNSTPLSQVPGEQEDELGNQEATGPEFPPQFPAGTTKIDVTDLTDWYRLGMDISDLDDADPEDYNQGPPQTVVVFPSDEAEQGYLKQFKRLGLKTHDMDPDVEGGEDTAGKHLNKALAEELQAFKEQDLFEVKMTSKNLANLAKDIKGAKVGLEFEMIVPNVANDENSDMEPDYDQDVRVRDIDDAVSFFDDGDYNGRNEIRRLRERMESDFFDWQQEKIDERWHSDQGFEFFSEYLDREDPFDDEEAEEEARNELQAQYGDEISTEDFEKMLVALVDEKRQNYTQEQWDEQGRNFDYAQEEFSDEQRDDISESEWLSDQNIRYASDVESNYGDVSWPYWSSNSDSEGDIESVALDFMNAMGMDSVAISSSYHGSYKKWVGNGWVSIGSNKPDDCFTIEPDGSLEGDDDSDTGLEFVSPPIPLEDIGTVMSKVQNWAGNYGAYTGDQNKTSIHTNISIPGYNLDKLDYLKAALLLGDEYVLREFDRIGNTYAAPAIEKVRALVKQNPDKAKALLDKMKSQLNAEASKLIHSGQTNKFTSINTKDNRVEFRSPGGDYLSIIADNPQKMVDTINRMVVTLDAAMDPNKYKEEYQKKLYKMLTGQQSGREAETGAKREMKKDDKDLLNIFSRYAAGELPRAALKSFVRQAQLERKVKAGKDTGKMWWNVSWGNGRVEVVASDEQEAKDKAFKESYWAPDQPDTPQAQNFRNSLVAKPLRPYEEKSKGPTLNGRPSNPDGDWVITDAQEPGKPVYRYMASDNTDAYNVLQQWTAANPGREWKFARDSNQRLGQPGEQPAASTDQGNWGIWINANDRFANQPGEYARGATVPLYRFPSREAAEQWIEQQRAARPNMRSDIEVREIEPAEPIPGSTLDLQRQRAAAAQQDVDTRVDYELYNRTTGEVIDTFQARNDDEARVRLDDFRNFSAQARQNPGLDVGVRRGPGVTNANNLRPTGPGPWEVASRSNNQVYYNTGHAQRAAAETEARTWLTQNGHNPADFEVRTRQRR